MVYALLFRGKTIPYNPLNPAIEMAEMFGFVKKENDTVVISIRIFETVLYNYFLIDSNKIKDSQRQEKRGLLL